MTKRNDNDNVTTINDRKVISHNGNGGNTMNKTTTKQTPIEALENALAGLHIYNCGSEGARGDLAKDYGLSPIPHQEIYSVISVPDGLTKEEASQFCRQEEERRGHTEETFKEYCAACDEHADAEMDHERGATQEIAERVIDVLRGSRCAYCGDKHTDPNGEYGHAYDLALMAIFERVTKEMADRADEGNGLWTRDDICEAFEV